MIFTQSFLIFLLYYGALCEETLNGRFTKSIKNFDLVVPHRKTADGDFHSFHLPTFFEFDSNKQNSRRKREALEPNRNDLESIHYGVDLNNSSFHIELWPNHDFLSPNLVFEDYDPGIKVQDKKIRTLKDRKLCHYTGQLRGEKNSRAAISTCDGLAGHIIKDGKMYYIEPVDEHTPNSEGHHLHILFEQEKEEPKHSQPTCGVTNDKWVEGWKSSFINQILQGGPKQKRGSASVYRYVESLAVCDKKFLLHHKSRDVENYLLTLMNMMFDLYHDASVGVRIDVILLRVIYLEKEDSEIDLKINADASATLQSFCQWQKNLNTENGEPGHHDVAILFTRHDLCDMQNAKNCGLVGLAYVSEICTQDRHCAINEDTGLMVAITATHELGHLLGCNHDEQGNTPCSGTDPADGSTYVMHPSGTFSTYRWSTCSRGFISSLFDSNLGECLNNEPKPSLYPYKQALPGVIYNANEQCHLLIPESHEYCDLPNTDFCELLWCKKGKECASNGWGPADGTKCGENKWCFRKKCVATGERPLAVDGGWGEWGDFSACSRTCGGGLSKAERFCDNPPPENSGLFCLGEQKKMKICNTEPCPQDTPSFRQTQCHAWNNKDFHGARHTWEVFSKKIDKEPCSLYCVNEQRSFAKLDTVLDGTPCKMGTKYMCIEGTCKKVGCDWELDSDAVEDVCGVCNGDGTQCKMIDEVNNEVLGNGYQKIAIIPTGARNVLIEELKPSINIIAIADKTEKKFYLNANKVEQVDGAYSFGKTEGVYSHPQPRQEKLIIHGPLMEDLVFMVAFFKHENVGYRYKYAEMSPDSSYTPSYHWELTDYGACSVQCGGGTKTAEFNCIESKAGKVSANFCAGVDKPNGGTQVCNEQACKTEWRTGKWGKCRACKNKGGVRTRDVECIKENPKPGGDVILVEDNQCPPPKPGTQELCETKEVCADRGKRFLDGIPTKYLKSIWSQMNRKSVNPDMDENLEPDAHINEVSSNDMNRDKRSKNDNIGDNRTTNFNKSLPYFDEDFDFSNVFIVENKINKEEMSKRTKRNNDKKEIKPTENTEEMLITHKASLRNSDFKSLSQNPTSLHTENMLQHSTNGDQEKDKLNKRNVRENEDLIRLPLASDEGDQDTDDTLCVEKKLDGLSTLKQIKQRKNEREIDLQNQDDQISLKHQADILVFKNNVNDLGAEETKKIDDESIVAKQHVRLISDQAYQNSDDNYFGENSFEDADAQRMKRGKETESTCSDQPETTVVTEEEASCTQGIFLLNTDESISDELTSEQYIAGLGLTSPSDNLGMQNAGIYDVLQTSTEGTTFPKMSVNNSEKGKIVQDIVPSSKKKVMIVELKETNDKNKNISDKVFQTMGDEVKKDVADRTHQKNLTGDAAVKELSKLGKDETTKKP